MTNTETRPVELAWAKTTFEVTVTRPVKGRRPLHEARWVREGQRGPWLRITAPKFRTMIRDGAVEVENRGGL